MVYVSIQNNGLCQHTIKWFMSTICNQIKNDMAEIMIIAKLVGTSR